MQNLLFLFLLSLGICLSLTLIIKSLAIRFDMLNLPAGQKDTSCKITCLGGLAIYLSFYSSLFLLRIFTNWSLVSPLNNAVFASILLGSTIVFLVGTADDLIPINPFIKLTIQAIAGVIAYGSGVRILHFETPWNTAYSFGILSLPATILWFILVINSLKLIDVIDGLAAGVSLFAGLALLAVSVLTGKFSVALWFAALTGTCLGFLRYNFYPASISMGKGGSYFLGYMLAFLSILGSLKSQATVSVLIPVIALGLPLMDIILAPLRRFIVGSQVLKADKNHIPYRLLAIGFSDRKAVLCMYAATLFLGFVALMLVHSQDEKMGWVFLILGIMVVISVRKLGYLEYIEKIISYFQNWSDKERIKKPRETFLDRQISIRISVSLEEMWKEIQESLEMLRADYAEFHFNRIDHVIPTHTKFVWTRTKTSVPPNESGQNVLSISLPLFSRKSYGRLHVRKDLQKDPINRNTLPRIEQLRLNVVRRLESFESEIAKKKRAYSSTSGTEDSRPKRIPER